MVPVGLVRVAVLGGPLQVVDAELPPVDDLVVAGGGDVAVEPGWHRLVGDDPRLRASRRSRRLGLPHRHAEDVVDVAVGVDGGVESADDHARSVRWILPAINELPVSTSTSPSSVSTADTLANDGVKATPSATSASPPQVVMGWSSGWRPPRPQPVGESSTSGSSAMAPPSEAVSAVLRPPDRWDGPGRPVALPPVGRPPAGRPAAVRRPGPRPPGGALDLPGRCGGPATCFHDRATGRWRPGGGRRVGRRRPAVAGMTVPGWAARRAPPGRARGVGHRGRCPVASSVPSMTRPPAPDRTGSGRVVGAGEGGQAQHPDGHTSTMMIPSTSGRQAGTIGAGHHHRDRHQQDDVDRRGRGAADPEWSVGDDASEGDDPGAATTSSPPWPDVERQVGQGQRHAGPAPGGPRTG